MGLHRWQAGGLARALAACRAPMSPALLPPACQKRRGSEVWLHALLKGPRKSRHAAEEASHPSLGAELTRAIRATRQVVESGGDVLRQARSEAVLQGAAAERRSSA